MTKTISKFGASEGLILFDTDMMKQAGLKIGDQMDITVSPESGAIVLRRIRPTSSQKEVAPIIKKTTKNYRKTLRKLS